MSGRERICLLQDFGSFGLLLVLLILLQLLGMALEEWLDGGSTITVAVT
jgi:hypothetical protein